MAMSDEAMSHFILNSVLLIFLKFLYDPLGLSNVTYHEAEMGLMQCMVTITQNDNSAENLAIVRRGPFAVPTEEERIEFLLNRKSDGADFHRCSHNLEQQMDTNCQVVTSAPIF